MQPRSASPSVQQSSPVPKDRVLRFPRPWLFDLKLSPRALALACAIVQWTLPSNRGGYCFYSARKLGELLGWSRPTVERALADLRAADILETARRGRRIVAPVMQSSINGDCPKTGNSINADGTLTKPRSTQNLRLEREGVSKRRSSLEALEERKVAHSLKKKERFERKNLKVIGESSIQTTKPENEAESVLAELETIVTAEGTELSCSETVRRKRLWAVKDALRDRKYPRGPDRGEGSPDTSDLLITVKRAISDGWAGRNGADVIRHALKNPENYDGGARGGKKPRSNSHEGIIDRGDESRERESADIVACRGNHEDLELSASRQWRVCRERCGFIRKVAS